MTEKMPIRILFARDMIDKDLYRGVLVDGDYDGEYFAQYKWRVLPIGYVQRDTKLVDTDATGKRVAKKQELSYLHREVAKPPKGMWVTFKNHNPLDCRSANLMWQTPSESALRRKQRSSLGKKGLWNSQYRGVQKGGSSSKGKQRVFNSWVAYVQGKYIGSYPSEELAAQAYDKAAYALWGDMANLNFPRPEPRKEVAPEKSTTCPHCQAEIYGDTAVENFEEGKVSCWKCGLKHE